MYGCRSHCMSPFAVTEIFDSIDFSGLDQGVQEEICKYLLNDSAGKIAVFIDSSMRFMTVLKRSLPSMLFQLSSIF